VPFRQWISSVCVVPFLFLHTSFPFTFAHALRLRFTGALGLSGIGSRAATQPELTRLERLWVWSNDPLYSFTAWLWAAFVLVLILVSSATFVLESVPKFCCGRYDWLWGPVEIVCITIFTLEYVIRFASCPWYFPDDNPPAKPKATENENSAEESWGKTDTKGSMLVAR